MRVVTLYDDRAGGLVPFTPGDGRRRGELDTGVAHALLTAVGEGVIPEALRVHPAGDVVAFGRRDVLAPGYPAAVRAARAKGFEAVERLAGGRAAVFHTGTLAFSWAVPTDQPRTGLEDRFETLAGIMVDAFRSLGADARVGEVPGEYCPGRFSVNIGGRLKVMGVGQRLVRGAAHVGGVVVVHGADRLREVLVPVYAALSLDWDPATTGALEDAVPGLDLGTVRDRILDAFRRRFHLRVAPLPVEMWAEGHRLAPLHLAPG